MTSIVHECSKYLSSTVLLLYLVGLKSLLFFFSWCEVTNEVCYLIVPLIKHVKCYGCNIYIDLQYLEAYLWMLYEIHKKCIFNPLYVLLMPLELIFFFSNKYICYNAINYTCNWVDKCCCNINLLTFLIFLRGQRRVFKILNCTLTWMKLKYFKFFQLEKFMI